MNSYFELDRTGMVLELPFRHGQSRIERSFTDAMTKLVSPPFAFRCHKIVISYIERVHLTKQSAILTTLQSKDAQVPTHRQFAPRCLCLGHWMLSRLFSRKRCKLRCRHFGLTGGHSHYSNYLDCLRSVDHLHHWMGADGWYHHYKCPQFRLFV
jgi:hypothetical protein